MADVPPAPRESGDNEREILFLTESDGAGGLRAVLFHSSDSKLEEGQYVGAMAVAGFRDDGEAAPPPVVVAGKDGSGNVKAVSVGTNGSVTVTGEVSGTVAHDSPATDNPVVAGRVYTDPGAYVALNDVTYAAGDPYGNTRVVGGQQHDGYVGTTLYPVLVGALYTTTYTPPSGDNRAAAIRASSNGELLTFPNYCATEGSDVTYGYVTLSSGSGQLALAAKDDRKWAVISNHGPGNLRVGLGFNPSGTGMGIMLSPGDRYEINLTNRFTGSIYVYAYGDSADVGYMEGV